MQKLISIVTPTYNEEGNIEDLCSSIAKEMSKTNYDYEHIVIDNNSSDKTISILRKLSNKDKKLKVIINTRDFGHIKSPIHGLLQTSGDASILMSSDFQDPPELIHKYIKEWENGHKVVLGQKESSDEFFLKQFFKNIFYKFIKSISELPLMTNTTGAGLFDREILNQIKKIDDPYPYFRGLLSEITSDIKLVKFHQPDRKSGKTKNNFYSLYDIVFFFYKILYWDSFDLGIAPLIIGLFGIASIQLFFLGFIGEYVMNILLQTRKLPLVIEKERINF